MSEMTPLKRHYLLAFPGGILFLLLGILLGIDALWVSFFILGYLWVWTLVTPQLKEKIRSPKYRFSFFRFIFWIETLSEDQLFFASDKIVKTIARVIGGIFFSLFISLVTDMRIVIANFLGLAVGEIWLGLNRRFYPDAYKKRESSLSENSL